MTSDESVRTPLTCGHYYLGIHRGPDAWCERCMDFAQVGYPPRAIVHIDGTEQ